MPNKKHKLEEIAKEIWQGNRNIPTHTHYANVSVSPDPIKVAVNATTNNGTAESPAAGAQLGAVFPAQSAIYTDQGGAQVPLAGVEVAIAPNLGVQVVNGATGASLPFSNMQLYLTLNFIIALQGIYPTRS